MNTVSLREKPAHSPVNDPTPEEMFHRYLPALPALPAPPCPSGTAVQCGEHNSSHLPTMAPENLEICLDVLVPSTLAAMYLDHTAHIAAHMAKGDLQCTMSLLQQDADAIFSHLCHEHFRGDHGSTQRFIDGLDHIPF